MKRHAIDCVVTALGSFTALAMIWTCVVPDVMGHERAVALVGGTAGSGCCGSVWDQQCPDGASGSICPIGVNYDLCDAQGTKVCATTTTPSCAVTNALCGPAFDRTCSGSCNGSPDF